jgi:hypothetical protein
MPTSVVPGWPRGVGGTARGVEVRGDVSPAAPIKVRALPGRRRPSERGWGRGIAPRAPPRASPRRRANPATGGVVIEAGAVAARVPPSLQRLRPRVRRPSRSAALVADAPDHS